MYILFRCIDKICFAVNVLFRILWEIKINNYYLFPIVEYYLLTECVQLLHPDRFILSLSNITDKLIYFFNIEFSRRYH